MPAITAAANPVNTVSPSSSAAAGKNTADTPDRSFSSVLAERTSQPSSPEPRSTTAPEKKSATDDDKQDDQKTVSPAATSDTAASPSPAIPVVPVEPQRVEGASDMEQQLQKSAELIQAVMTTPAGGTPGRADNALNRRQDASLTSDETLARGISLNADDASKANVGAVLSAGAGQTASATTTPFEDILPAKLAVSKEVAELSTESAGAQKLDPQEPKVDLSAAASTAVTTPSHVAMNATTHAAEYRITAQVGTSHWENSLGNSVMMMSNSGQDRAELVLTPPQLGRIEVSISMKGDEANAVFVSANPAVRDALENALPRLREVLADAGIMLGQAQVGAESRGQSAGNGQTGDNTDRGTAVGLGDQAQLQAGVGQSGGTGMQRYTSRSLVDIYA